MNKIAKIDLFFIGSILDSICTSSYNFYKQRNKYIEIISKFYFKIIDYFYPLIIYGAGFISPQKMINESYIRNIKIIAVRGNITLQRFKKNGVKIDENIILADPGILASMLLNITNTNEVKFQKKYDLCIIPHYIDMNYSIIKKQIQVNNSIILNINNNPINFIESILKCKNVLSSGLHGLIIADSLGIPNMRMVVSDNIIGGDYKFMDYYSAYNLKLPPKIDIRITKFDNNYLKNISNNHYISKDIIRNKQCDLLSNFPFKLRKKYKLFKKSVCNYNH